MKVIKLDYLSMYDRFMKYLVFITKEFDNFETQKWKMYRAIYFEKSNLI